MTSGSLEHRLFALRDNARLLLIHPEASPVKRYELADPGVYICCSLAGNVGLEMEARGTHLSAKQVHLLRGQAENRRRTLTFGQSVLGLVAHISHDWCQACPQGPTCPIGLFLLHGPDAPVASQEPSHQSLEFDASAACICQSILQSCSTSAADILHLEMGVLELLSWTYSRGNRLPGTKENRTGLPLRKTIKIRQAAELLRSNLDRSITITELSRKVGLSESDLKRGFRLVYDTTPARYSRSVRLEAARDLLRHSSMPIASISIDVGFSNPSQFSRAFRLQFGCNPSDIRA
ncbi:AraC family transcriptional regulator [Roseibium aggregatum]|uniref:Helix-turn-helix transcriptional regulator n=1 Tax=Roseibium aggregatum TaxID=187304 RepID=A0A939EJ81_9HYPH|nr:AraC family transcriptional regulator [Roseibium aggregatum]MBN9672685.1 helix-turn-helix transcriptional regulator [Roseibium aggregatum]